MVEAEVGAAAAVEVAAEAARARREQLTMRSQNITSSTKNTIMN